MSTERIPFPHLYYSHVWEKLFYEIAEDASRHRGGVHLAPLEYLVGAEYPGPTASVMQGPTYKSLAYVGHRFEMDAEERQRWYNVAARLSLSQAHIGCIIAALDQSERMMAGLEEMLRQAA